MTREMKVDCVGSSIVAEIEIAAPPEIVLDALTRRERVMTEGRAHTGKLVRRDGRADAAAAQQHRALGPFFLDCMRDALGVIGIIIARHEPVGAAVEHLVPSVANGFEKACLEREAGVVRADGHSHGAGLGRGLGALVPMA